MGLPRSSYVQEGEEGVYHCFSRCVRRAFLYGYDAVTQRDFSHRKSWLVGRLRHLAAVFAIEVCAYAVMVNHYHTVLRTRPDVVAGWSDREVARRWLTLFPRRRRRGEESSLERDIMVLVDCPKRIAELRRRLVSLSWFMGRLNEYMARAANKEDGVKGRFWEGRFRCQALLDEAAIAACMVYVDLNPIRAGVAGTPEGSDFTSIQERIRAWQTEGSDSAEVPQACGLGKDMQVTERVGEIPVPASEGITAASHTSEAHTGCWLCPIQSDKRGRGILQMTAAEYIDLVDKSGRITRSDKRGAMEADLKPILLRIGAKPEAWHETISGFGSKFCVAAGLLSNLRRFADRLGRRWLRGVATARAAFAPLPPQPA